MLVTMVTLGNVPDVNIVCFGLVTESGWLCDYIANHSVWLRIENGPNILQLDTDNGYDDPHECLIDLNKYHYLVCGCIVFDCRCTDVWTNVRMDGRTDGHFYQVY